MQPKCDGIGVVMDHTCRADAKYFMKTSIEGDRSRYACGRCITRALEIVGGPEHQMVEVIWVETV